MKRRSSLARIVALLAVVLLVAPAALGGRALFTPRQSSGWLTPLLAGGAEKSLAPRAESRFDAFNRAA